MNLYRITKFEILKSDSQPFFHRGDKSPIKEHAPGDRLLTAFHRLTYAFSSSPPRASFPSNCQHRTQAAPFLPVAVKKQLHCARSAAAGVSAAEASTRSGVKSRASLAAPKMRVLFLFINNI
jgi:hypothetical protein